jgi:hypothetical protein
MKHCEVCGQEIPVERLECVPDTRLCIEHARKAQKFGGEFILRGVQCNIGKTGSLKRNYGDVEVYRRRNHSCIQKLKQEYDAAREALNETRNDD